jgi:hypothetical protein
MFGDSLGGADAWQVETWCVVSAEGTVFNSPGFRWRSIRATLAMAVGKRLTYRND